MRNESADLPIEREESPMPLQQDGSAYRGYRTAGIRLTEELDPRAVAPSVSDPVAFHDAAHWFDKAHAVMLTERGIIPRDAGQAILAELRALESGDLAQQRAGVGGERHAGEQHLIRVLGEDVGGHINLARSSGDLGAVCRRLVHRTWMLDLADELVGLREVLAELSLAHAETIMPGYTHGQVAQSTTFGHWLSMWASVFARDSARIMEMYPRMNLSPAGAAMLTGSDVPINRERTAELLGFDNPIPHTMDAILSHDTDCLEAASVLGILAANLGRLADDLQLWFTAEFGFVDFADRYCGTSSIMPQKRNPDFPEATKSVAVLALSGITTAFAAEKGPTGSSFRERRVTDDTLCTTARLAVGQIAATTRALADIEFDAPRALATAKGQWAQATDLAVAITRHAGLPWRSAHQIVGVLVRVSKERSLMPSDVDPALLDEAAIAYIGRPLGLARETIRIALDPRQGVQRRSLTGGPAPQELQRTVDGLQEQLTEDRSRLECARRKVNESHERLASAVDEILED